MAQAEAPCAFQTTLDGQLPNEITINKHMPTSFSGIYEYTSSQ